ncbi:MAG: response regulator [Armatimonadetes bacterium]|nr:response regulator [Armatimonadota bacterium]
MDFNGLLARNPLREKAILVVSERERLLERLSGILKEEGYRVHTTQEPVEAERLAEKLHPALMVIDWKRQGLSYDGLELLFVVRKNPHLKDIRLLFLAPRNPWYKADEFLDSLSFGPDDFITAPFNPDELLAKTDRLLGSSQERSDSPDD